MTDVSNADNTVTSLLREWAQGHAAAGSQLFSLVYDELRSVARRQRRPSLEDTLNTTALVHEVYLRLNAATALSVQNRAHFYAVAAQATRQILSNYARRRRADKRGSGSVPVALDDQQAQRVVSAPAHESSIDRLWDLEHALRQLHTLHPRACDVVECRFFGGLSIPDTAIALGISEATVKRDWALAQAWLCRELQQHASTP